MAEESANADSFEKIPGGEFSREEAFREALSRQWYHSIELAPGRVTSGAVDLRAQAERLLPPRGALSGARALDVGTFDGFWAYELERRGAAQVVATDLDRFDEAEWPPLNRARLAAEAGDSGPGQRFWLAHRAIGSDVRRVVTRIYDLSPELIGGPVDYAVLGDLLIHLRDPVRGLEAVRGSMASGGRLLIMEELNVLLTLLRPRAAWASFQARGSRFNWWQANLRCLEDWLALAGFQAPHRRRFYKLDAHGRQARWHVAFEARVD